MKNQKKTQHEKGEKIVMRIILDEALKKRGLTDYKFAKEKLHAQPNAITPLRKPGYDPKLSTLIKFAKILDCDINELFEAEGYKRKPFPDGDDK